MMRTGRLMVAVLMLTGVVLLPAVASGSPEPNVEICHFNADNDPNAPEWELLVVNNNSVAEKHLAHGDGVPEGEVPGTDGEYVFDENCVPQLAELILAVAYTDIDPNDGPYDSSNDVLIAKLVDGPNGDEVLSAGDLVVMGQYPKTLAGDSFGSFRVSEPHVITAPLVVAENQCSGFSSDGLFVWSNDGNGEKYHEFNRFDFSLSTDFQDGLVPIAFDIVELDPESPSQPHPEDEGIDTRLFYPEENPDHQYVDVEFNCTG